MKPDNEANMQNNQMEFLSILILLPQYEKHRTSIAIRAIIETYLPIALKPGFDI
jgi:hypothetical protein